MYFCGRPVPSSSEQFVAHNPIVDGTLSLFAVHRRSRRLFLESGVEGLAPLCLSNDWIRLAMAIFFWFRQGFFRYAFPDKSMVKVLRGSIAHLFDSSSTSQLSGKQLFCREHAQLLVCRQ